MVAGNGTLAYVAGDGEAGAVGSARSCGSTARGARRPSRRRRARMFIRGCRPRARASRCGSSIRSATSGSGIWAARRSRASRSILVLMASGVDARRPPADLQFDRAGARNLFWQAADGTGAVERPTESPNMQDCDGRVARRPPADLHRDGPEDGRRRHAARSWTGRVALRRSCRPRSPSGTGSSRPTAAGSPTRRMTRAGSRSTCGRFLT